MFQPAHDNALRFAAGTDAEAGVDLAAT